MKFVIHIQMHTGSPTIAKYSSVRFDADTPQDALGQYTGAGTPVAWSIYTPAVSPTDLRKDAMDQGRLIVPGPNGWWVVKGWNPAQPDSVSDRAVAAAPAGPAKRIPAIKPEVWYDRLPDPTLAMDAVRAMCGGSN